jgi:hypothetical protein
MAATFSMVRGDARWDITDDGVAQPEAGEARPELGVANGAASFRFRLVLPLMESFCSALSNCPTIEGACLSVWLPALEEAGAFPFSSFDGAAVARPRTSRRLLPPKPSLSVQLVWVRPLLETSADAVAMLDGTSR